MRILCAVFLMSCLALTLFTASPAQAPSLAEGFAQHLAGAMASRGMTISDEQMDALVEIHPLLVWVADNDFPRAHFWETVRLDQKTAISTEEAVRLVTEGKILTIHQHPRRSGKPVYMLGRDGQKYTTNRGDLDFVELGRSVDPSGVFIGYVIE